MGITCAVGDLHGRADLLEKALSLAVHRGAKKFVVCGDFVDRGPASKDIIDCLMRGRHWGMEIVTILGNHEDMMIEACFGRLPLRHWLINGGGQTLASYGYQDGDLLFPLKPELEDHLIWLANLPWMYADSKRLFVHAGINPNVTMDEQKRDYCTWVRSGREDDYEVPYEGLHVVHGHEQYATGPIMLDNRTNLDTHAYAFGRLAVGVFDDDKPGGPVEILWAEDEHFDRYAQDQREENDYE